MMQDFEIRRATIADADAVLPLVRSYRVFYEQQPNAEREREFIEQHLRNASSVLYLAQSGGVPAAFMQMFKTYSTVHLSNAWILEDLFVAPDYRNRGIARALLERAIEHAREDGACGMFLETAVTNIAAQRLYESAGWTKEARFFKYNAPLA
jgi:ribosomal protein S18 acetylase RimI-like enzyme